MSVPSTDTMPREGSFALASLGRVKKVHPPETAFAVAPVMVGSKAALSAGLLGIDVVRGGPENSARDLKGIRPTGIAASTNKRRSNRFAPVE